MYRSPTASSTLAFLDEFSDHLDETVYYGRNLIVLGDFNFYVDDTSDADATKFIDMIEFYIILLSTSQYLLTGKITLSISLRPDLMSHA